LSKFLLVASANNLVFRFDPSEAINADYLMVVRGAKSFLTNVKNPPFKFTKAGVARTICDPVCNSLAWKNDCWLILRQAMTGTRLDYAWDSALHDAEVRETRAAGRIPELERRGFVRYPVHAAHIVTH
jgi:hypothetical protein